MSRIRPDLQIEKGLPSGNKVLAKPDGETEVVQTEPFKVSPTTWSVNSASIYENTPGQYEIPSLAHAKDVDTAFDETGRFFKWNPAGYFELHVDLTGGVNALQPGDNVSELVNDAGYLNEAAHDALPQDNPHGVTKAQVGLSDVDNTSDMDKPVSTAQGQAIAQAESDAKQYTDDEIVALNLGSASQSDVGDFVATTEKGVANGVATLDGGGKVLVTQLPSSVMTLEGQWNASTNTPTLSDGTGDPGMVYEVTTSGTQDLGSGNLSFNVGDFVVYGNDGKWYRSINSNEVVEVNGKKGVVVLDPDDLDDSTTTHKFVSQSEKDAIGTAVQPGDLASVATSGSYNDLSNTPAIPNSLDDLSGDSDDISEGTTNLFMTPLERSKLTGIASGAEVNVNADWNAVSGDAQILNKPTLGTAASADTGDFATAAQGSLADTAIQPTDDIDATTLDGRDKHLYGYYTQIGGQARGDRGMSGLYDRTVTTDADLRGGGITVDIITGSATIPNTSTWLNAQSDHAQLSNITPGTEVDIIIDNGENASAYSAAQWQPFFQKRLSANSEGRFRHIKVSVSQDQITWATPSNGAWEITDFHDDPSNFEPRGFWFGGGGAPGMSGWRYVKFELKDFVEGSSSSYGDGIYIVQLGIRHVSERYARQYMRNRDFLDDWVLDEDDMISDSDTKVPTQQSVKAYVQTKTDDAVTNTADTYTSEPKVTSIVSLTQAEYDAIVSPDPNTLYIIP